MALIKPKLQDIVAEHSLLPEDQELLVTQVMAVVSQEIGDRARGAQYMIDEALAGAWDNGWNSHAEYDGTGPQPANPYRAEDDNEG